MAERRTIGEILLNSDRIDEEDLERALEYQQQNGGYFGEALVALGMISQDELEWGLASQFDLPYVFPEAESIDPEAAALVSPEWALAHLALPIMSTGDTLTVIVDSPTKTEAVNRLQARTDKQIELALASATRIRELIREVYARAAAHEDDETPSPVTLEEFLGLALDAGSIRFGISTRGQRAWSWYDDSGRIRRRPLEGLWKDHLEDLMTPPPSEHVEPGVRRARWSGHLTREGIVHAVEARYLGDESGREFLFRPVQEKTILQERFDPPAQGVRSEIRLLARSGSARFVVTTDPESLGHELLPHLPTMLLDSSWRSVCVTDRVRYAAGEAFCVELPRDDRETWVKEFEDLRPFHFDAVTVDLPHGDGEWVEAALDVASVAFLRWDPSRDRRVAHEAGIRWELRVEEAEGDRLEWSLEPLQG